MIAVSYSIADARNSVLGHDAFKIELPEVSYSKLDAMHSLADYIAEAVGRIDRR
jgi:anion-transporting  ArsA/GET3 family ATPase